MNSIQGALTAAAALLEELRSDESLLAQLETFCGRVADSFRHDHKLLICGNGGSMADAMHIAEEFSGRFKLDRRPYPAIALSDPAHMSCVANDYGFDHVFSRQVQALGSTGDILLVLSTTGKSPNLIRAAQAASERGVFTTGLLGQGGGPLAGLCDLAMNFPGQSSDRIQELHMLCMHAVIESVEQLLGHWAI